VDQIRFGNDYAPSDFRLYNSPFNNDLQILQINGPHAVVLDSYFQTPNRSAIESVVFERTGTVWNFADGSVFRNVGFIGTSASETVTGTSFSDVLIGQGGNDDLRGGDGDDVYGFFGVFGRDGIRDPSGQDTIVIGAEYAEVDFRVARNFGDLVISQVTGANSITLESYFNATNNSTIEAVVFARTGTVWNIVNGALGVVPGFFDYSGYLSANPDVRAAGLDPYAHYVTSGWREGRDPSARFDTSLYLKDNPDVAAAGINPLQHYLTSGQAEGRVARPAVGALDGNGFDAKYYLLANPDVGLANIDAFTHYVRSGWREGRDPSSGFDTSFYLNRYADVRAAGIDPLQHYQTSGWREGRDPSASFDTSAYLTANPDVAAAGINPLQHYLVAGIFEGRSLGDIQIG
jgi:serralysin